jgi:hypothetical protein
MNFLVCFRYKRTNPKGKFEGKIENQQQAYAFNARIKGESGPTYEDDESMVHDSFYMPNLSSEKKTKIDLILFIGLLIIDMALMSRV